VPAIDLLIPKGATERKCRRASANWNALIMPAGTVLREVRELHRYGEAQLRRV
jgi:hypothetical protein